MNSNQYTKEERVQLKLSWHDAGHIAAAELLLGDGVTSFAACKNEIPDICFGSAPDITKSIYDPKKRVELGIIIMLSGMEVSRIKYPNTYYDGCSKDVGYAKKLIRILISFDPENAEKDLLKYRIIGKEHQLQLENSQLQKYEEIARTMLSNNITFVTAIKDILFNKGKITGADIKEIRKNIVPDYSFRSQLIS